MTRDPASAPPRPDLAFLRRRTRRPAVGGAAASPLSDFVAGHTHHPPRSTPSAAPSPVTPVPIAATSSLDLDERPVPATPPAPDPAPAAAAPTRPPAAVRRPTVARVATSGRVVLDGTGPSVTLSRVQSGIGALWIEAACPTGVGDLRLGCAYRFRSGESSVVTTVGGSRTAPPEARLPVLVAGHDRFERIGVDLRRVRDIERLMVYGFSETGSDLDWAGTIAVTTHAGARVEAPLLGLGAGSVAVFVSIYQVEGELAIWSEMLAGRSVRDACRAFGFDEISWVDDRTPLG